MRRRRRRKDAFGDVGLKVEAVLERPPRLDKVL